MSSSVTISTPSRLKSKRVVLGLGAAGALLAVGAAFWIGTEQQRELTSETYAAQRMPLINAQLAEAREGYIFLAGDSHSELLNATYRLCGKEVVNGGLSGAKAELYRQLVSKLGFKVAPDAVVFSVGTNNLLLKKKPLTAGPLREFEDNVVRTISAFRKKTPRVIALAVPPISAEMKDKFEIEAVKAYSQALQNACKRSGCELIDPYDFAREADGNTAREKATSDGVHLSSYRAVQARMEELLCPGGAL